MSKIEAETAVKVLRGVGYDVTVHDSPPLDDWGYRISTRSVNGSPAVSFLMVDTVLLYCRQNRVARLF